MKISADLSEGEQLLLSVRRIPFECRVATESLEADALAALHPSPLAQGGHIYRIAEDRTVTVRRFPPG